VNKIAEFRKNESPYVKLARKTIEKFIISGELPEPFGPQEERKGRCDSFQSRF